MQGLLAHGADIYLAFGTVTTGKVELQSVMVIMVITVSETWHASTKFPQPATRSAWHRRTAKIGQYVEVLQSGNLIHM